jgi:Na+-transporting methylmalonyl-CoA/oxaloacetate decarboxylase gamma subunit
MFKRNKKGQMLELIGGTVVGLMVLIFTIFAVLYGISALNPSSFFTAGSASANATTSLQNNLTQGVGSFGSYIPTVLLVLGVVLVLAAIAILIVYVRRMQGGGTGQL